MNRGTKSELFTSLVLACSLHKHSFYSNKVKRKGLTMNENNLTYQYLNFRLIQQIHPTLIHTHYLQILYTLFVGILHLKVHTLVRF